MIQLYRPGASLVHRAPAGLKLLMLAIAALVLSIVPHTAVSVGVVLGAVVGLYALAGLPLSVLAGEVWRLRWLVAVLAVALLIFVGPLAAWVSTGRMVAIILLAGLLTLTTPMSALLDVLRRVLAPLARFGIDIDAVAMTVSLAITMIPVVAGFAREVTEAQRARGARLGLRGIVPLLVRTLRHSDDVADALAARGIV